MPEPQYTFTDRRNLMEELLRQKSALIQSGVQDPGAQARLRAINEAILQMGPQSTLLGPLSGMLGQPMGPLPSFGTPPGAGGPMGQAPIPGPGGQTFSAPPVPQYPAQIPLPPVQARQSQPDAFLSPPEGLLSVGLPPTPQFSGIPPSVGGAPNLAPPPPTTPMQAQTPLMAGAGPTLGGGMDPGLAALAQSMSQPTLQGPMVGAAVMSGFGQFGGQYVGNPVWEMALKDRDQQLQRQLQLLTLGSQIRQSEEKLAHDRAKELADKSKTAMTVGMDLLKMPSMSMGARQMAAKAVVSGMQAMGMQVPEGTDVALMAQPLSPERVGDVAQMLLVPGITPEQVATATNMPMEHVGLILKGLENEGFREAYKLPLPSEAQRREQETRLREIETAEKELNLWGFGDTARQIARVKFGKPIHTLTETQKDEVAQATLEEAMTKMMAQGGLNPMSAEASKSIIELDAQIQALDALGEMLDRGTADEFIGPPLSGFPPPGLKAWWAQNVGTGLVPPDLTILDQAGAMFANAMLLLRSGNAVTATEEPRVMRESPDRHKDKPDVYRQKFRFVYEFVKRRFQLWKELSGVGGRAAFSPTVRAQLFRKYPMPTPPETPPGSIYFNPAEPDPDKRHIRVKPGGQAPSGYIPVE